MLFYYWILFKNSSIRLAVVSDPAKEEEDCEDIGYAFVDVNDIMNSNRNYLDQEIACNYFYLFKFDLFKYINLTNLFI